MWQGIYLVLPVGGTVVGYRQRGSIEQWYSSLVTWNQKETNKDILFWQDMVSCLTMYYWLTQLSCGHNLLLLSSSIHVVFCCLTAASKKSPTDLMRFKVRHGSSDEWITWSFISFQLDIGKICWYLVQNSWVLKANKSNSSYSQKIHFYRRKMFFFGYFISVEFSLVM